MGKSKTGGTRGYIRGRIANDVYSIGKDGKGKKQQVIRSLAESVANPRTSSQMFGRMIMSTVMQAVSGLSFIIDHSFDNVPSGQPSISEFIRRNYGLVSADAKANPATGNKFGLNKYQEKGTKTGPFVISAGDVQWPAKALPYDTYGSFELETSDVNYTLGELLADLGIGDDGYLTFVGIYNGVVYYGRLTPKASAARTTVLTSANFLDQFDVETNGKVTPTVTVTENKTSVVLGLFDDQDNGMQASGVIFSVKESGSYKHNDCALYQSLAEPAFTSNVALPTYPTGTEMFLNGGDI